MPAEGRPTRVSWLSHICLGIYRYLPLPFYYLLLAAYWLLPFLRARLAGRLAVRPPTVHGAPVVWFHASSVGEVSTIAPVVAEVHARLPDCKIVVSTMTVSGRRRAAEILKSAEVFLLPIDFYPCVKRLVSALTPFTLVIGETEIWPNLVSEAHRQGAHIVLLNGRISSKSYPRYRLVRPLMRAVLGRFDYLLMRTDVDAERIVALGANPEDVAVVGNTKYDILPRPLTEEERKQTRRDLNVEAGRGVITLGSAREGECEIVFQALRDAGINPMPLLIVAPRHMGLVPQVEQLAADYSYTYRRVPGECPPAQGSPARPDVIIIAEMGRLLEMYAISDVAIVGGTFKPFGGHNPLESASQGVVTMVGPHIQNIEDDIEYLRSRECAFIAGEETLGSLLRRVLSNDRARQEMGKRAAQAVEDKKGIARKCVDIIAGRQMLP
jgi:3-deoxy-D-manno-octulosonic-acid transferase